MCVVVRYADSWILLASGQMFQNITDEVSSWPQTGCVASPSLRSLPPTSGYIKLADGGASFHSVNKDISRHESGGTAGAGGGFTCQYSL